tara:strand:+ start:152 stop:340 length:189 start_codon:yes stop_codon:yes gene_type:complete
MNHSHSKDALRLYVVLTSKGEYSIEAAGDEEAAFRAESLCGLMDESLKDLRPATPTEVDKHG